MNKAAFAIIVLLPAISIGDEKHLATPPLSLTARALLHDKMADHSKQMMDLMRAVVLLDYSESAELGKAIAAEERLSRPLSNDATELNSALDPRFFTLQDQLRTRGKRLEAAARARDSSAVAKTFGALTETCVACHSAYLTSSRPRH